MIFFNSMGLVISIEPMFIGQVVVDQFVVVEVEADFVLGGFGGIAAVDEVKAAGGAEVAADGSRFGFIAEGFAHEFAGHGDDAGGLEDQDQDGAAGDVVEEGVVEGFAFVDGIVLGGQVAGDVHKAGGDDLEAFFLETGDDAADELALDGVGLDDDEGSFHGCSCNLFTNKYLCHVHTI